MKESNRPSSKAKTRSKKKAVRKKKTGTFPLKDKTGTVIDGTEVVRDVTKRIKALKQPLNQNNITDMIINSMPGIYYISDEKGNFLSWNRELEALSEYSHEEVAAGNLLDYFKDDEKEIITNKIKEVFTQGKASAEAALVTKSGREIPHLFSGSRITIDGTPYLAVLGIEIDRLKQTEEMFNQTRHQWEDTFNTITDMITVHDNDFNIIHANKAAEKMLGLPLLRDLKVKCFQYYHGTKAPPAECPSCECMKTGEPAAFELFEPFLKKYIEIRAIPRFDSKRELVGLIHIVRDISDRKKTEESIQRAKTEWENTFDNTSELIALIDGGLNILRCNRSFAEFVLVPVNEIVGKKFTDLLETDSFRDEGGQKEGRTEIMTSQGKWLYLSFCPIFNEEGGFLHSIVVGTDITELKNFQKKLSASEKELKLRLNDLEKFYEMSVGRELRMKELKRKIKKLEQDLQHNRNR